jgi:hypothetical protein
MICMYIILTGMTGLIISLSADSFSLFV